MTVSNFTFSVDDKLKAAFTEAVKAKGQTEEQLLRNYMRYVIQKQRESDEYDIWLSKQGLISIDDAKHQILAEDKTKHAARREEIRRRLEVLI
ncbi:hypothetical protein [Serratia proteamaculans]|uniref:hypothetical protein n=1 Tax=Serratia proteamaculans TaxID=28151 RepID=UPI0019820A03|nr:hypothetical protein [Serratia proteamaculans]